ncbi:hypothetical protein K504DRAFT_452983 [Pleomassaria siparia CBS 279.74]|uniref:Uncharacterized protein n=1 Tax=Pleomassaria siparia CBS 279.74 TaxID=1314801 RepID=A0A6G1JR86_9PLEO|nr:hypothetical protein K504DRAFT_452983 [Pleomassaria siparia CBS 279.74]
MARLGGLASDHHLEGPGDAPRRRRGRKLLSQSPSMEAGSSASGKRAASPTETPSQSRRVKRVQMGDREQLAREQEDALSRSSPADEESPAEENAQRIRRHSEPFVTIREEEDEEEYDELAPHAATQPLPGLTPHLDRIGASRGRPTNASRRSRMSMPAQLNIHNVDETNGHNEHQFAPLTAVLSGRTRRRLRRSHLSEEVNDIVEHKKQDMKMRKAMADLRRELREKDKALGELAEQLEASRQGAVKISLDEHKELEQRLDDAIKELQELKASTDMNDLSMDNADAYDDDDDDDEVLDNMLIDPADLNISPEQLQVEPHENGFYASHATAMSSQVTFDTLTTLSQTNHDALTQASQLESTGVPDRISDQAEKRFESELERMTEQLATSQGALRVIAIELQNLHVVPPGASSKEIITALRHGFEDTRILLEAMFPNSTTGMTNTELLKKMYQMIQDIMVELGDKVDIAERHNKTENMVRAELSSVLELLSKSDAQNKDWESKWFKLDQENDANQRQIVDLEDRIVALNDANDEQDALIRDKDIKMLGLEDEIVQKDTSLQRFRAALDKYRSDVENLTNTVTRLEQQHAALIAQMTEEHEAVVGDLQTQLENETEARENAEFEARQKTEYIEDLEERIANLDSDIEEFTDQMTRLKELLDQETEKRMVVESEREEQETISYNFSVDIEKLEDKIEELKASLDEYRTNLEAERIQRVRTEASLDEANERIDELNNSMHNAGIQSNELRSKLFQVQQEKEAAIALLKEEAKEREDGLEELLEAETRRREVGDEQIANLALQCTQLQTALVNLDNSLAEMTQERNVLEADRDEKVAFGNRQRDDLVQQLAALENTSSSTITTLQANITDLTNEIAAQRAAIQDLKDRAARDNKAYIDTLADRDHTINVLEGHLVEARDANESLTKENRSLAKRVEDEAHELLNIMGSHAEEANLLRQTIATQGATIINLQATATQRATQYAEELEEKFREIEELRMMGDSRAELIAELQGHIEDMKERFRLAEEDTRQTMDRLVESQRRLQQENEELAATLLKRNADALTAIQEMKVNGLEVKTSGVTMHKVANGKITKVSEKVKITKKQRNGIQTRKSKRVWDSGFGMDENEADEGVDEAEGLIEA